MIKHNVQIYIIYAFIYKQIIYTSQAYTTILFTLHIMSKEYYKKRLFLVFLTEGRWKPKHCFLSSQQYKWHGQGCWIALQCTQASVLQTEFQKV